MLLDIDELEDHCSRLVVHESLNHVSAAYKCTSMDYGIFLEMKRLLLGHHNKDFPEEWKIQNFSLRSNPQLIYGIIQKKGGPCGVLACVQAYIMREFFFASKDRSEGSCNIPIEKRCLALAMAHILWKCGNGTHSIVAFPHRSESLETWPGRRDGFSEKIGLFHFDDSQELQKFLVSNVIWYTFSDFSVISLLYSVLLSRGIDAVKQDMDDPQISIIGKHGYCSQELVNLLLTGEASSNVFDGNVILDEKSSLLLKGVQNTSEIGFLTLMEHSNTCKVGKRLKHPEYPIWVICSESHFSVLFCKQPFGDKDLINSPVDIFYYDTLSRQEDEIHLTLTHDENAQSKLDVASPLEHCIRTRSEFLIFIMINGVVTIKSPFRRRE
ncbi:hypothetical protein CHUAL_008631 [Chamberlinius hualienensis]